MGLCMSAEDAEEKKRNDEIDMQLKREKAELGSEIKMLLLGAGESGEQIRTFSDSLRAV